MKNYTKEQIHEFILSQPDDKPVNMGTKYRRNCSCLLGEFAKSERLDWHSVGIYSGIKGENGVTLAQTPALFEILESPFSCVNFGNLKDQLKHD